MPAEVVPRSEDQANVLQLPQTSVKHFRTDQSREGVSLAFQNATVISLPKLLSPGKVATEGLL